MVIVIAHARLRADARSTFQTAAAAMIERTLQDAGCIAYAAHQTLGDPDLVVFVERWASRADVQAHMAAAHTQAFLALAATLVTEAPVIEMFDVS